MISFETKRKIVIITVIAILCILLFFCIFQIFTAGYTTGYLQCLQNASQTRFDITGIPKG
jgi:hypothetical protein